jgi:hypothetical protein
VEFANLFTKTRTNQEIKKDNLKQNSLAIYRLGTRCPFQAFGGAGHA